MGKLIKSLLGGPPDGRFLTLWGTQAVHCPQHGFPELLGRGRVSRDLMLHRSWAGGFSPLGVCLILSVDSWVLYSLRMNLLSRDYETVLGTRSSLTQKFKKTDDHLAEPSKNQLEVVLNVLKISFLLVVMSLGGVLC